MKQRERNILHDSRGATLISTLVAATIIACAIGGVGVSSLYLRQILKKAEVTNLAVAMEADLVNAFNNKANFPTPEEAAVINAARGPAGGGDVALVTSPTAAFRAGTITRFNLETSFGVLPLVVQNAGSPTTGTVGFLNRSLDPCGGDAFSEDCVLRYEVRLRKTAIAGTTLNSYAFSYQIDVNPDVAIAAPLGNIASFDAAIDPGSYRVEHQLAKCNSENDLFMTGMNRDTGEAFCAEKPLEDKCPNGRMPKGLKFTKYDGQKTSGVIELDCTTREMRTVRCPANYGLKSFKPAYADPEDRRYESDPGECVFLTNKTATLPDTYPASPTPYLKQVAGNFCPPFYKVSTAGWDVNNGCRLAPDEVRNSSLASGTGGRGFCAFGVGKKNCSRTSYDRYWYDNTTAYEAWQAAHGWDSAECVARRAMIPARACATDSPASGWYVYTCGSAGSREHAAECGNNPSRADDDNGCSTKGAWSGTEYAYDFREVPPVAAAVGSYGPGERGYTCKFEDRSVPCPSAPAVDRDGNRKTYKNPKWYGGVQVQAVQCTLQVAETTGAL